MDVLNEAHAIAYGRQGKLALIRIDGVSAGVAGVDRDRDKGENEDEKHRVRRF